MKGNSKNMKVENPDGMLVGIAYQIYNTTKGNLYTAPCFYQRSCLSHCKTELVNHLPHRKAFR